MADFDPPFAADGERRAPTSSEQSNGFPCGPADQRLFNFLQFVVQSEIDEVIQFFGLTPDAGDLKQLRKAIEAAIAAATGAGDTSQFLLVSQARARLPIFPDTQTADNKLTVSAPSTGTIRLASGGTFLHRGVYPITTVETDFLTDASKIYHLRWNEVDGYALLDLASGTYNPTTLAETDPAFDSTYDDMLIARVVTNSSNVATITALRNQSRTYKSYVEEGSMTANSEENSATRTAEITFDYARTPEVVAALETVTTAETGDIDLRVDPTTTRYGTSVFIRWDFATFAGVRVLAVA